MIEADIKRSPGEMHPPARALTERINSTVRNYYSLIQRQCYPDGQFFQESR